MNGRYRLLAERIANELLSLEAVVKRATGTLDRLTSGEADHEYFVSAAALDLHGLYTGLERLFSAIATEVDGARPHGLAWHRELLAQMTLEVKDVRPAAISADSAQALTEYLEFRHIVRNVYAYTLKEDRVTRLLREVSAMYTRVRDELREFAAFLEQVARDSPPGSH